jgi:hypothetical protein
MILYNEINPDRSLYAIGSEVIALLRNESADTVDVFVLYDKYRQKHKKNISVNYFIYALDWLYLINLIEFDETKNKLKRCF